MYLIGIIELLRVIIKIKHIYRLFRLLCHHHLDSSDAVNKMISYLNKRIQSIKFFRYAMTVKEEMRTQIIQLKLIMYC